MAEEQLEHVRYVGPHDETIVRVGGFDQRAKRGDTVLATPEEADRLAAQEANWERVGVEEFTVPQLRELAAQAGIEGRSNMNRDQLLAALGEAGVTVGVTVDANPIGAVGDPEAVREANRIARQGGIGIADQAPATLSRSADDLAAEQAGADDADAPVEPGVDPNAGDEPKPAPIDSQTVGEVDAVPGQDPPATAADLAPDAAAGTDDDVVDEPADDEGEGNE